MKYIPRFGYCPPSFFIYMCVYTVYIYTHIYISSYIHTYIPLYMYTFLSVFYIKNLSLFFKALSCV